MGKKVTTELSDRRQTMNIDRATAAQATMKHRKPKSGPPVRSSELVRPPLYNPSDDPSYRKWVADMAQHCRCAAPWPNPCDGVLAGGLCDDMGNGPDIMAEDFEYTDPDDNERA